MFSLNVYISTAAWYHLFIIHHHSRCLCSWGIYFTAHRSWTLQMSLLYLVDSRSAVSRTPRNQTWSDLTDQALIWASADKHKRRTEHEHYSASALSSDNGDAVSPCAENVCFGNQSYLIRDRKALLHCRSGEWAWLITVGVCCGYSNWPTLLSVTDAGGYASCNWSIILLPFQAGRNKSQLFNYNNCLRLCPKSPP